MADNCSTCDTTTCSPCAPYDNCGCLNPTTFECVTKPGECEGLGITDDMTGKQAVAAACSAFEALKANEGKVLIDANDTCPEHLWDKLGEGTNISFTQVGTGCDKKLYIHAVEGGEAVDVNVQISSNDTTSGYLYDKIDAGTYMTKTILTPGANEKLRLQIVPSTLLSADVGNVLTTGADGKLKVTSPSLDGSETKIINGTGVVVSGNGTLANPYIISTNSALGIVRPCFDSIWRAITILPTGNANVSFLSGSPQYRYRYDGTLEFKGSLSYTVAFGAYSTPERKFTITIGTLPTSCLTLGEQAGVADLKGINYIDIPQASADQVTQQYGYIVRKSSNSLILEFQSSFTNATSKTVVVNLEGAVSHPSI